MKPLTRLWLMCVLLSVLALYMGYRVLTDERFDFISSFFRSYQNDVLFVGDVMLARTVETQVRAIGEKHFFDGVLSLHEQAPFVVGNFEAVIPETHTQTPNFTFQFSVDTAFVPMLSRAGFTHFSLANNHANDYGKDARAHTVAVLKESGITSFGSPSDIGTTSVTYIENNGTRIALIGLQTVIGTPDMSALDAALEIAREQSDVQIAVVHWGEEYQLLHSASQEVFAKHLVGEGIDAIIGHHPHVVQDIGSINGVPVFYSLGNYVFDQYFSTNVETGLAVLLRIEDTELLFSLEPVMSNKSVLRMLTYDEKQAFLASLSLRSDSSLQSGIMRGVVRARF